MSSLSVYRIENLYTFISTGDKTAMYTLRVMTRVHSQNAYGAFSYTNPEFIKILSNDKAKAETLAQEISDNWGVPFKGNAEFELNAIRRERDELKAEQIAEIERNEARRIQDQKDEYARIINEGILTVGKYAGKTVEEVYAIDIAYVFWLAGTADAEQSMFNVSAHLAAKYIADNEIQMPDHVGSVGDVIEVSLLVRNSTPFEGMYGTSWVMTCTDSDNNVYTFFTTSRKLLAYESGSTMKVKATIKEHSFYRNFPQTLLKAPKLVKAGS